MNLYTTQEQRGVAETTLLAHKGSPFWHIPAPRHPLEIRLVSKSLSLRLRRLHILLHHCSTPSNEIVAHSLATLSLVATSCSRLAFNIQQSSLVPTPSSTKSSLLSQISSAALLVVATDEVLTSVTIGHLALGGCLWGHCRWWYFQGYRREFILRIFRGWVVCNSAVCFECFLKISTEGASPSRAAREVEVVERKRVGVPRRHRFLRGLRKGELGSSREGLVTGSERWRRWRCRSPKIFLRELQKQLLPISWLGWNWISWLQEAVTDLLLCSNLTSTGSQVK